MWRDRGVRVPRSTIVSGAAFLALQGFEWAQLIGHGLTTSSSLYGSFFYTIVGCHALHALAGLAAIGLARTEGAIAAARIYWTFVVAIWPPLYVAVYLW
jgi:cytochrome c oxidase subunit 3